MDDQTRTESRTLLRIESMNDAAAIADSGRFTTERSRIPYDIFVTILRMSCRGNLLTDNLTGSALAPGFFFLKQNTYLPKCWRARRLMPWQKGRKGQGFASSWWLQQVALQTEKVLQTVVSLCPLVLVSCRWKKRELRWRRRRPFNLPVGFLRRHVRTAIFEPREVQANNAFEVDYGIW